MSSALYLDNLQAGYGGPPVLHDVSLHVAPGEVVALLGSNGAGKSTVARAITGFARISAGRVLLGDTNLIGIPAHEITRAGVGHVPEGRRLFQELSVEENMLLTFTWQAIGQEEQINKLTMVYERFPLLRERGLQRAG